jgi:hypothetical protein
MEFITNIEHIHIGDIKKDDFDTRWLNSNKPVLIKGILEDTPAKNWSIELLEKELGHFPVKVFDQKRKNNTSFLLGDHQVPMNHMLHLIRENKSSDLRMFVNPILTKNKKLANNIPCPPFFKCAFQLPNLMFIGGKGTIVPLHYDFMYDDGLLTQFFGRKEIILIEPRQSKYLNRIPFNSTSMMNLFEPNESEYPGLKNLRAYRVMLDHGDTIFIPSGYWHQMTYVDASLSIGFRKWNPSPLVSIKTGLLRMAQIPFDKILGLILGKVWFNWKINKSKSLAKSL